MKNKTMTRIVLLVLASFLLTTLAAPMAQAQAQADVQLTFNTPTKTSEQPIKPDTGEVLVNIPWEYRIRTPAASQLGAAAASSTTLTWDPPTCTDSNILVTGSLTQTVNLQESSGQPKTSDEGEGTFVVRATQDAPGETPIVCTFSGKVDAVVGTQIPATDTKSATTLITVDYLGLISTSIPTTIKQAGPQKEIRYDIEVSNLGNARSQINFRLANEVAGGWNPVPPQPIVLQSMAQGGEDTAQTVSFLVSTPFKNGWNNKDTTFILEVTPVSTKDPEKVGQTVTLNVLSRVRGVYVPSVEPFVMVAAVLGAALVARRLRQDE